MIILKNTGSGIFEEVHFILREGAAVPGETSEPDMIREANRILEESQISTLFARRRIRRKRFRRLCLAGTALCLFAVLLFLCFRF